MVLTKDQSVKMRRWTWRNFFIVFAFNLTTFTLLPTNGDEAFDTEIKTPAPEFLEKMTFAQKPEDQSSHAPNHKFVLIDTDAGVDDAWALFLCLRAHLDPEIPFTIVGITTVIGNTRVDQVMKNVGHVLETMGVKQIPLYRGSNSALVYEMREEDMQFYGQDGFGDAKLPPLNHSYGYRRKQHAVAGIIELAEKYFGNLTILTLGPLTNLARAVKRNPKLPKMIKEIYAMFGNYQGIGNTGVTSEFNVFADPEAAGIVLENFYPVPIHIMPWETCLYPGNLSYSFRVDVVGKMKTRQMSLLNKIEARMLSKKMDGWISADSMIASILLNERIVTKSEKYWAAIELTGNLTRGMMVVDRGHILGQAPNVDIVTQIDVNLYKKSIVWAAGGPINKFVD